jgi:hypothetical protein
MVFAHGAKIFFIFREPNKRLLTTHEVNICLLLMYSVRVVFTPAYFVRVIFEVKGVDNLFYSVQVLLVNT